jgi:hypothetical protein
VNDKSPFQAMLASVQSRILEDILHTDGCWQCFLEMPALVLIITVPGPE